MPRTVIAAVAAAIISAPAMAQDAPCKSATCVLAIDWGAGKSSADFPPDRRYGSGDDFESGFRAAMGNRGYRLTSTPTPGAAVIAVRPTTKARVMCDSMAGTNPDLNCTAITLLAISWQLADPKEKPPSAMRVTNRCAAGDIFMPNRVFAQYAAEMIWWQLEGQAQKADRPSGNC